MDWHRSHARNMQGSPAVEAEAMGLLCVFELWSNIIKTLCGEQTQEQDLEPRLCSFPSFPRMVPDFTEPHP